MLIRFLLLALLCPVGLAGEVFLTKEEALTLAFPECEVTRTTVVLTKQQKQRVAKLSGLDFERSLVYPYVAT